MHEMSMSLATEIKSEIRGVINRVEDVLSSESADESGSVSAPLPYVSPVFVPAINTPVFDLGCCQQSMMVQSSPLAPLHRTLSSPCTSSYFQVIHLKRYSLQNFDYVEAAVKFCVCYIILA